MIEAYGGEANLRKHKSVGDDCGTRFGEPGYESPRHDQYSRAKPGRQRIDVYRAGKKVAQIVTFFDGNGGGEVMSFAPPETYSGKRLDDIRNGADFYDVLNWKTNYKNITIMRIIKVGDEEAYVVEKRPEKGTLVTDYVSTSRSCC